MNAPSTHIPHTTGLTMLFSSESASKLNALSATSLNSSALQSPSAAISSAASGLIDPLQQTGLTTRSSASLGDLVSLNPQPLPPRVLTSVSTSDLTLNTLNADAIAPSLVTDGIFIPTIPLDSIFGTPGGSTLETATNLGSLNGTRSLYDLFGVSSTSPNDYYRVTLGANSNFNLILTGLQADVDVLFLNSVGTEIARSSYASNHDEAINLSGLAAGDYYVRVYQFSGDSSFSLDISSTAPSNLVANEFDLGTVGPSGATRTGSIGNSNTADVYRFNLDGFYRSGDIFGTYNSSNLSLSLTGLSADADVRIIRDSNNNGVIDAGEEIVRSSFAGSSSETINLSGLGVGNYFAQVYQFSGATNYTLNLSAQGGSGLAPEPNDTLGQAYNVNTLNGTRIFSGHVSNLDPRPWTFDWPRDMNDYYRFSLGATSNFNLSLTGLNGDADVVLLDSNGAGVHFSNASGTASESISRRLNAGDYYVRVYPFGPVSTDYTLSLSAAPV